MRLKITGDGTLAGTKIVTDNDLDIEGIIDFEWAASNNRTWAKIQVDSTECIVDFTSNYYNQNISKAHGITKTRFKIVNTATGVKILEASTDEEIIGLMLFKWESGSYWFDYVITLDLKHTPIQAPPHIPISSGVIAVGPTISPAYNSPYTPVNSANPYYPFSYSPVIPPPDPSQADSSDSQLKLDLGGNGPQSCIHEWVNAGFSSVKLVCKHCNAEK